MFSGWSLALHWRSIQLVKVRSQGFPRDERGDNKSHPDQSLLIFTERHFATEGDILRMASQINPREVPSRNRTMRRLFVLVGRLSRVVTERNEALPVRLSLEGENEMNPKRR